MLVVTCNLIYRYFDVDITIDACENVGANTDLSEV